MSTFHPLPELTWRADEVVREIDDRPHLLARVEISGTYFPQRAAEPFVRVVVGRRRAVESWFAEVSDDNQHLRGYFPVDLPRRGAIEFGYGHRVMGRLPGRFDAGAVTRLDRHRLPRDVVVVSARYVAGKR